MCNDFHCFSIYYRTIYISLIALPFLPKKQQIFCSTNWAMVCVQISLYCSFSFPFGSSIVHNPLYNLTPCLDKNFPNWPRIQLLHNSTDSHVTKTMCWVELSPEEIWCLLGKESDLLKWDERSPLLRASTLHAMSFFFIIGTSDHWIKRFNMRIQLQKLNSWIKKKRRGTLKMAKGCLQHIWLIFC